MTEALKKALESWHRAGKTTAYGVAPVRALKGQLFRRLSAIDLSADGVTVEKVSPAFVAAVVLAAYDAAGLVYAPKKSED